MVRVHDENIAVSRPLHAIHDTITRSHDVGNEIHALVTIIDIGG